MMNIHKQRAQRISIRRGNRLRTTVKEVKSAYRAAYTSISVVLVNEKELAILRKVLKYFDITYKAQPARVITFHGRTAPGHKLIFTGKVI